MPGTLVGRLEAAGILGESGGCSQPAGEVRSSAGQEETRLEYRAWHRGGRKMEQR